MKGLSRKPYVMLLFINYKTTNFKYNLFITNKKSQKLNKPAKQFLIQPTNGCREILNFYYKHKL